MKGPFTRTRVICLTAASLLLWPYRLSAAEPSVPRPASFSSISQQPQQLPETPTTLSPEMRGDILVARHQYAAAIDAYRQGPKDSAVLYNKIGIAYQHLSQLDEARSDYQRALHLKRNYPEALNNLGTIAFIQQDYRTAEKLYRRALKSMPNSAVVYSNLGTAYFAEKKFQQGATAYRQAFALDPLVFGANSIQPVSGPSTTGDLALENYCLARIFAQAGMKDQALEYLRQAINDGFSDRKRMMDDQEFASLRNTAEFEQLMSKSRH